MHASSPACNRILRFTSGATPADLLVASMVAKPFPSTYFQTSISGARDWDLSWVWDQADALMTNGKSYRWLVELIDHLFGGYLLKVDHRIESPGVVSPGGSIVMRVLVPAPGWLWLLWGAFRHHHPEAQRTAPGRSLCQMHRHTASSNMVNNETVKWPANHWRFFMLVLVSKILMY